MILRSFCPQVYGMYLVKLAMCVVLAGGKSKEEGGSHVRGESHLLLVGDPGTGKSQLLKYASKLTPRSVFTTGTGTTTAGLTVAAVKENGTWNLEAGALVLADSGVCCIDEFSNIKEHDRVSIHEAMEQQTISTAKAGIVSKLSTRCTVIAATNPKFTKYDPNEDIELNVGLPSPLLSRFDLVIVLRDAQNEAWDELLCDFLLGDTDVFDMAAKNAMAEGSIWDTEALRSYMVLIKEKKPDMTEEAETILSRYYHLQRNSNTRIAARTTVRLFESLYRLAEGHARLMYRECVLVHDAIIAISLVEASMQSSALTGNLPNPLHISFPPNPLEEYHHQARKLLELLNLPELWLREKIWLTSLARHQRRPSNPPPPPGISKSTVPTTSKAHLGVTTNASCGRDKMPGVNASEKISNVAAQSARISGIPEGFFETGDDDDQIPCSCRIVTSTQKSNVPSKDAALQKIDSEVLSPIAPSSATARFRNVLKSPTAVYNSSNDDSYPRQPPKRKRSATVTIFEESDSDTDTSDNEVDKNIENKTPPPIEAVIVKENDSPSRQPTQKERAATTFDSGIGTGGSEIDKQIKNGTPLPVETVIISESSSVTDKPAGVSKFRSVLSRFRRD